MEQFDMDMTCLRKYNNGYKSMEIDFENYVLELI